MNNFIKENWFRILLVLFLLFGMFLYFGNNSGTNGSNNKVKKNFLANDISSATKITCTYPQTISALYQENEISHSLNEPEKNPMIFTFSKLDDPKMGSLSFIDATQTITTVPIVRILENEDQFIYVEGDSYFTVHTIYKKTGISTYSKNINFFDTIPSMTSAMGSCVGY